jgi:hypothetical protein
MMSNLVPHTLLSLRDYVVTASKGGRESQVKCDLIFCMGIIFRWKVRSTSYL